MFVGEAGGWGGGFLHSYSCFFLLSLAECLTYSAHLGRGFLMCRVCLLVCHKTKLLSIGFTRFEICWRAISRQQISPETKQASIDLNGFEICWRAIARQQISPGNKAAVVIFVNHTTDPATTRPADPTSINGMG